MDDLDAFFAEDAIEIEVFHVERAADFTSAIIPNARPARTEPAVGDVELVAVTPWPTLWNLDPFVINVTAAKVVLDHLRDGAPFHEGGQHLDWQAEVGGN